MARELDRMAERRAAMFAVRPPALLGDRHDIGPDTVFAWQVIACGRAGDVRRLTERTGRAGGGTATGSRRWRSRAITAVGSPRMARGRGSRPQLQPIPRIQEAHATASTYFASSWNPLARPSAEAVQEEDHCTSAAHNTCIPRHLLNAFLVAASADYVLDLLEDRQHPNPPQDRPADCDARRLTAHADGMGADAVDHETASRAGAASSVRSSSPRRG